MARNQDRNKVQFDSKIRKIGGSYYILIKRPLKKYLELRDGSNVEIMTEEGDYGPYISVWNPSQQEQQEEEK